MDVVTARVLGSVILLVVGGCHETEHLRCRGRCNMDGGVDLGGSGGGGGQGGGTGGGADAPAADATGTCTPASSMTCYTGPAGTEWIGTCKDGTKTCTTSGSWGSCTGQVVPLGEVACNNSDDDCDGTTDAYTVKCSGSGYCPKNSTCGAGGCPCVGGYAPVNCVSGISCAKDPCTGHSAICVTCPSCDYPKCNLTVSCAGGWCPTGSSCVSGACWCPGSISNCDGSLCTSFPCAAGWYCN